MGLGRGREVVVVLGLAGDGDGLVGVGRCARPGVKEFRFLSIDLYFPSRRFPPLKARVYTTSALCFLPPLPPNLTLLCSFSPSAPFLSLSPSLSLSLSRTSAVSSSRFFGPVLVKAYSSSFSLFPPKTPFLSSRLNRSWPLLVLLVFGLT